MKNNPNHDIEVLWHNAPEELPCIDGNPDYEGTIPCLVKRGNFYGILFYDCYYKCWNDSEDDDFECDNEQELKYIQLEK